MNHWLGIVMLMLGAALCLELQDGMQPEQQKGQKSTWIGQLHRP